MATLVLTGELASLSGPVAALMKGAMHTMFLAKSKLVGVLLLVACLTLGAGTVAYHPVEAQNPVPAGKPLNKLDTLRRENALLKLNLEVVLEKVRAQASELKSLKRNAQAAQTRAVYRDEATSAALMWLARQQNVSARAPDIEVLLRNLREANTGDARTNAIDALEKAVRQLREDVNATKKPAPDARPK